MNKLLILTLLCAGCDTGLFLRYQYTRALNALPQCSRVREINNDYIAYSLVETSTNGVHTNLYKAHYTSDGKIFKTELYIENAK